MKHLEHLLITTLHKKFDDHPWVSVYKGSGTESRLLHARPEQKMTVVQFRACPGARTGLHRHLGPVLGITTKGAWSHHPEEFPYQADSYVCEPTELHRFHNGPDLTEVFYINLGDTEWYDEEGREVIGRTNASIVVERYLQGCEEMGLPRPNVLG